MATGELKILDDFERIAQDFEIVDQSRPLHLFISVESRGQAEIAKRPDLRFTSRPRIQRGKTGDARTRPAPYASIQPS